MKLRTHPTHSKIDGYKSYSVIFSYSLGYLLFRITDWVPATLERLLSIGDTKFSDSPYTQNSHGSLIKETTWAIYIWY